MTPGKKSLLLLVYSQTHHRQVVIRFRTITMFIYLIHHFQDYLLRIVQRLVAQYLENAFVAKLDLFLILSLVKSVRIEKQGYALDIFNRFTDILKPWPQANRCIRLNLHELRGIAHDGRVMSGITIVHTSRLQVNQTHKHRDKHALIVILRQRIIHTRGNIGRFHMF